MDAAGLRDILLSFPLVGAAKTSGSPRSPARRRCRSSATPRRSCAALSAGLAGHGAEVGFLVECDTGFRRTGVQSPAAAAELAVLADSLPGLRFEGLMTYPTLPETGAWLRAAREAIEARGLRVERVSAGGTPTWQLNHLAGEVTEVRAGTYVYGDRSCIANGSVPLDGLRPARPRHRRQPSDARPGDPRPRLEDADERSGRGGRGRRPRARRRVSGRPYLRALGGARARRRRAPAPTGPGGRRGRHDRPESRLRLHQHARRGRRPSRRAGSSASGRSPPAGSSADPRRGGDHDTRSPARGARHRAPRPQPGRRELRRRGHGRRDRVRVRPRPLPGRRVSSTAASSGASSTCRPGSSRPG